jgi:hypothetical protein
MVSASGFCLSVVSRGLDPAHPSSCGRRRLAGSSPATINGDGASSYP